MDNGNMERDSKIRRRTVLSGLSATGALGLAGCAELLGEEEENDVDPDDEDPDELGERVPVQTMSHFAGFFQMETAAEAISVQLDERLGIEFEISALDTATAVGNLYSDNRFSSLPLYYISSRPEGTFAWQRYTIDEAGTCGGGVNTSQWANCAYSVLMKEQGKIPEEEQRREVINEALRIRSHDLAVLNGGVPLGNRYGYRTDHISFDEDQLGTAALLASNPSVWETVEIVGDVDRIEVGTTSGHHLDAINFFTNTSQRMPWNNMIHSKLFYADKNYELMNADLAESVEISDDGLEYTVELVDDATFHNGDPVTAEDVKFTFEWLTANPALFPDAPRIDLEVEAVDDTTAVFHLDEPYAPLLRRDFHTWGILHEETWVEAGAWDDPEDARPDPEDLVGSGPWEITSFDVLERLTMEPYTDHHHFDPHPSASLTYNVYGDLTASFEALRAGDLSVAGISAPQREEIDEGLDDMDTAVGADLLTLTIMPQWPMAPTKFFEFREAVAMAINYEEIAALTTLGEVEPDLYAETTSFAHPNRPPDEMLYEQGNGNPAGDPEAARAVLEEEGWGWDDDGNLHYPPDADLSPRWEEEGTPDPADYPCLEDDCTYVRPDDDEIDLPVDLDEYIV